MDNLFFYFVNNVPYSPYPHCLYSNSNFSNSLELYFFDLDEKFRE